MFGLGREQNAPELTAAQVATFAEISRKYSTSIPGRNTKVWELAGSIATKITVNFDERIFMNLIKENHIEQKFNSGWSYQDSLSRWYALGAICLARCLMSKPWNDLLPSPFDLEVYDASQQFMWIFWRIPDAVKFKVDSFMGASYLEIKQSFRCWDDRDAFTDWFRRYGDRLIGSNPPWEIRNGKSSAQLETLLKGDSVIADVYVGQLLSRWFIETGTAVLNVVKTA